MTTPPAFVPTLCGTLEAYDPAMPTAEHNGETVYLCHAACLRAFLADPDRFVAGEIEHPAPDPACPRSFHHEGAKSTKKNQGILRALCVFVVRLSVLG